MAKILVLVAALTVAGCSADPSIMRWSKSGATQAELDRDDAQCKNEGLTAAAAHRAIYASEYFRNCMVGRGWRLRGTA